MDQRYDFIVLGAGAAGRSFVYQLLQSSLSDRRILLVDREQKQANDRTWCFWETEPGPFEEIVCHRWPNLWFYQGDFATKMDIGPFTYKMVQGEDYYAFTDAAFADHSNVECLYGKVDSVASDESKVVVEVDGQFYEAEWCMNSLPSGQIDKAKVNYLDQHFRGWFIETEEEVFQPDEGVLMDFRTPQEDEFRFLYVLPDTPRTALVEVAIFSNNHLTNKGYDDIIEEYMNVHWPQAAPYRITRTENGNIPMTDHAFPRHDGRLVYLGMAGGDTRASTGYTFLYIHRRVASIIESLEKHGHPLSSDTWRHWRHQQYDRIMLHVLCRQSVPGDELFRRMFEHNPPQRLLRFLNAESLFLEEAALMKSLPVSLFLRSAIREYTSFR